MGLSHKFPRPLLIYDDKCTSCMKFAKAAKIISRGRIHIVGHYYSKEAIEAKKIIFPVDYDPTNMFWLITKKGAYGARSGLVQVAKEIIIGLLKGEGSKDDRNNNYNIDINHPLGCDYRDQMISCGSTTDTLRRIINMMRNSDGFRFQN